MTGLLAGSVLAFALALGLTIAARTLARRFGLIARPRADRWHQRPVALLGGMAIWGAFMLVFAATEPAGTKITHVVAMGTALFFIGLIDDIRPLKPYVKLIAQVGAAAVLVGDGLRLPWSGYDTVDGVITLFWLIGITNAFNLLDNMDGLAAGIAVIASAFLVVHLVLNGQIAASIVPAVLAGSALGFLVFNFNPASIFMGDSGSMFLGFVLAGTALLSEYGRSRSVVPVLAAPVLILLLPIFDTCLVTVTRRLSGRAITSGGRDHTSHRLVALGMSERHAVLTLYGLAIGCGALGLVIRFMGTEWALLLMPIAALVLLFLGLHLGKLAIYDAPGDVPQNSTIIRALAEFPYKRRVLEVVLDVILISLAYWGSYVLRFDAEFPPEQLVIFVESLPLVIGIQLAGFLVSGLYRGLWRYVGLGDILVIGRAVMLAVVSTAIPVFITYGFRGGASRVVFILDAILLILLVAGSRISFRIFRSMLGDPGRPPATCRPILIYGAGDGGELLLREMLNNGDYGFAPVGFIDDDLGKVGKQLHGVPIYHRETLRRLVEQFGVTDVVVSSSKVPEHRIQEIREAGVSLKRMRITVE